jgi:FixJ family two-component response regulator
MPGVSGARLAKALRERQPNLPIVLASGYAELPEAPVPGMVRLSKPFTRRELYRAIEDARAQADTVGATD